MKRTVLTAALLACPALAQGPDCGTAPAIAGTGVHAFDLTGRAPAGAVGGGSCPVDTGGSFGDVFWQWTCTTAGDFQFEISASHSTNLVLYEGHGCTALQRTSTLGYTYSAVVPDLQPGDEVLVHLWQHVNSPDAVGTLTVADFTDACSTAPDDAYEDNDRFDTAVPIGAGSFTNLFVWHGDEDYFRAQVPVNETIRVDWQWAASSVELLVRDATCGLLQFTTAGTWSWTNTTGAPVDLILNFRMRSPGADCSTYDFDVMIAPAPCLVGTDDGYEPNDTCAGPAPITVGSYTNLVTRDNDHDYYSTLVMPGHRLSVVGFTNAILVAMYDPGCVLQSEAARLNDYTNHSTNPETIVFRVRPDSFYSDGCEVHDIVVSTAPDFCVSHPDDPFEDNDTPQAAAPIGNGFYPGLWVSLFDTDFYSTCVAPGDTLQVQIGFPDNIVALDLALSNAPGVQYEYFIDIVRATYTNQTARTAQVGIQVLVQPILSDCSEYDLDISGASSCPPPVTAFCLPGGNNSTGGPTSLETSFGSGIGSGLHLEAVGGPPGQFGYFLISAGWIEPGGQLGDGRLCLTNPVGRYNGADGGPVTRSVGQFDASGRFVNLAGTSTVGTGFDVPSYVPLIGAIIAPGDTWSFQLWHRDMNPLPTSNFSTGVAVGF